ncbi:hypothetical protein Tco_1283097 [Tanacetum coccineum]
MSKNDMKKRICTLFKNDLKDLVKTYCIPQDLHPRLPDPGFTMDRLPGDAIDIYTEFLWFFGICIPVSTFLLSVLKYFKVHISQLVPLGLNKVVSFEVVCRDLDIAPTVTLFCVFQCLCKQEVWFSFSKCHNTEDVCMDDGPSKPRISKNGQGLMTMLMSIYDFMTLPSWSDAQVVEESHNLSSSLLYHVSSHTTAPAAEGAMISLPTADEIAASLLDLRLAKKSKEPGSSAPKLGQTKSVDEVDLTDFCAEIETSLERDEGTSARAASAPVPCLGKRLGAPPSVADVSASGPSPVGTSIHASTSGCNLSL